MSAGQIVVDPSACSVVVRCSRCGWARLASTPTAARDLGAEHVAEQHEEASGDE